ncbi:hypothetical protein [Lysobacter tyrosinilyticus]
MRLLASALVSLSCLASALPAAAASSPVALDAIARSTGAVLRGEAREAVTVLSAVPAGEFEGADATYRGCMLQRFGGKSPVAVGPIDGFAGTVLAAYQDYWWRSLMAPDQRVAQEQLLLDNVRKAMGKKAGDAKDFETLEPLLQRELEAQGYHALLGSTPPLRELMLWRKQTTREYQVDLPEGMQNVRAELLDDFVSFGWSGYGRCERGSTGGWATEEALYAVVPAYKDGMDSEAFRIVFLSHEAQHFADKRRFSNLENWELEYRAKLVELAYAGDVVSHKRLGGFISAQGDDPAAPHPYANGRVVAALRTRLGMEPDQAPLARLQEAAKAELLEDSRRREAAVANAGSGH